MRRSQNNPDVKAALKLLRSKPWREQFDAIHVLAENTDPATDFVLLHLLEDRHPGVREIALEVLVKRNEVLGRIAARATLDDSNGFVRNRAATVLYEVGTSSDVGRLVHALHDTDWVVRSSAADSLGQVGGKVAWRALQEAMVKDRYPVVRRDAAFALAESRQAEFIPALEKALSNEPAEQAKIGIIAALYLVGQREYLAALLQFLRSEDSAVRHAVLNMLLDIVCHEDRKDAIQAIQAMIAHESNPGIQTDAQTIVENLMTTAATT